jgi:hypothetical protein
MVDIQASKHTEENYGGPHLAPVEVIVVTRAISAKSSENQVFCHQFGIPLWRCVWDSNHPFTPNPTEAGGEPVLRFFESESIGAGMRSRSSRAVFAAKHISNGPGSR